MVVHKTISILETILINKMHNQRLFYNVNILKNYCDYLLHIYNNYEILCSNSVESVKFINIDIVS